MTKQISRIIVLATFAGLVAAATGCKCVCKANRKEGLATIVCQPMNFEVTDTNESVKFEVVATGCGLTYRWYRYDQPLDERYEKERQFEGVFTKELTVLGEHRFEAAPYHCEIGSKNSAGEDMRTSTRVAYLYRTPSLKIMSLTSLTPTANLPPPGAQQTYSNFTYCSASSPFRNITPTNANPTKCLVTLMTAPPNTPDPQSVGTPVNTAFYTLKVMDGMNKPVAVQDVGDGVQKWFTPSKSPYVITVLYNCTNCPSNHPIIYLSLQWPL
jgi:hypothetical protein